MATPTDVTKSSYSEQDKLGPLGMKSSALHDPTELRSLLVREFEAAAQSARETIGAVERGAADAVHQARKALRRGRAILALVEDALPKSERKAVKSALQQARRSLSTVRDHAVAPETLATLALSDEDRATANQVLANAKQAMPATAEVKQLLAEAAARAAAQAEALQAALPHEIDWDTIGGGIRNIYAQARKASRAAKRSKSWFHAWRRRSKELAYQLQLVAQHAGPRVQAIHSEVDGVTDTLGPAVDLIMLRDFVATYAQGIAPEAIDHLRSTIDTQLDDLMKAVRKSGRDSFRQKPKKLEKRIAKSLRRDLTPPDEGNGHGDVHA